MTVIAPHTHIVLSLERCVIDTPISRDALSVSAFLLRCVMQLGLVPSSFNLVHEQPAFARVRTPTCYSL